MVFDTILSFVRKVNRTFIWLAITVLFVLPLTLAQLIVPKEKTPSEFVYKANSRCVLYTDNIPAGITVKKGESVTVLGFVEGDEFNPHQVWVETSSGNRGYLPVEALDNKAVIYPRVQDKNDSSKVAVQYKGDVVSISGWKQSFSSYTVVLPGGKKTDITLDNIRSPFAEKLRKYIVRRDGEGWRPMSEDKFKDIVMSRTLAQMEKSAYPPHFISREKGSVKAIFPVRVFNKGKFYAPVVSYDETGQAVDYYFPTKCMTETNGWLLRMMPFYGKICDLSFVWPFWTKGVYDTSIPAKMESWQANAKLTDTSRLWYILVNLLIFLPLILVLRFTPALLLPLFVFSLLRIPEYNEKMSNARILRRVRFTRVLKIAALVLTIIWCVAGLVDYTVIPLVLGSALAYWIFCRLLNTLRGPEVSTPTENESTIVEDTPDEQVEDNQ